MRKVSLNTNVMIMKKLESIMCLNLESDELYVLTGDVGLMLLYINDMKDVTTKQIEDYLDSTSSQFKVNAKKEWSINSALSYLEGLKLIKNDSV